MAAKWCGGQFARQSAASGPRTPVGRAFFGSPDLYLVRTTFGYFAADLATLQQAVFLEHCRDASTISNQVERLRQWLSTSGVGTDLHETAAARYEIVRVLEKVAPHQSTARATAGVRPPVPGNGE